MITSFLKPSLSSRQTFAKVGMGTSVPPEMAVDSDPKRALALRQGVYLPFGAAKKLWSCRDEVVALVGPVGTGKSRSALEKIHYCCSRYKRLRVLGLRKTRESMTESALVTYETEVLPPDSPLLNGPQRNIRQSYRYPNTGAQFIIGGMDKSSKIMSTQYDMIVIFEATELYEGELEDLLTRNRNGKMPYQQVIMDLNPGAPGHWIRRLIKEGKITEIKARLEDNPLFYWNGQWTTQGKNYRRKLERLTGARYKRLVLGEWATAEGAVYDMFDSDVHIIESRRIPNNCRKIRTIDFGYTDPFCCQWWALLEDNFMVCYRELYMTRRLVRDHARTILEMSAGEKIEATVADWDAEGRADLEDCGISTVPAFKEIKRGLEATALRMRLEGDGKPRLAYMRDRLVEVDPYLLENKLPLNSTDEIELYIWKPTGVASAAVARDGPKIAMKDEPIDKFNHGMDTMRYAVAYFDDLAENNAQVTAAPAESVSMPTEREIKQLQEGKSTATIPDSPGDFRGSEAPFVVMAA